MKRGRNHSQDSKVSSRKNLSEEQSLDGRIPQRPRTSLSAGSAVGAIHSRGAVNNPGDPSNQNPPVPPLGGGVFTGEFSSDLALQSMPNQMIQMHQSPLAPQLRMGGARDAVGNHIVMGARATSPSFGINNVPPTDNRRQFVPNSFVGSFHNNHEPRAFMTASHIRQFSEGRGEIQAEGNTPSADPQITVGHDANGMPIVVPTSVALSFMSRMNSMPPSVVGAPEMPHRGGTHTSQQQMPYPMLPPPPTEQQPQQQPPRELHIDGNVLGGPQSSNTNRQQSYTDISSNDNMQPNAWRPPHGGNIMMGSQAYHPIAARQPPGIPPHMHGGSPGPEHHPSMFNRGPPPPAQGGWFPSQDGTAGRDGQLQAPMIAPRQQHGGLGPQYFQQSPLLSVVTRAHTLHMACDDEILSDYQCLVRKQIEVFEVQAVDIESSAQGRNKPLVPKQVGIRCRHCANLPPSHRARGSTYYPAKLQGLYQAAQNMASNHLCGYCLTIPVSLKQELRTLRDRKSPAGGGKNYWADGVKALGVYEDEACLRFSQA